MKIRFIFISIFIALLCISGCSWVGHYIKKLNDNHTETANHLTTSQPCVMVEGALSIYAEDMNDTMNEFLKVCEKEPENDLETKAKKCFLNLAIFQMILRPDQINPYSRAFVVMQKGKSINILNTEKIKSTRYWSMLLGLAKGWNLTSWFGNQVLQWSEKPKVSVKVKKSLEEYLKKYAGSTNFDFEDFSHIYYRGEELISEGEDLAYNVALKKTWEVIKDKNQSTPFITPEELPWSKEVNLKYSCNFDLNKVSQGAISPYNRIFNSKIFAVKIKDFVVSLTAYNNDVRSSENAAINSYFFLPKVTVKGEKKQVPDEEPDLDSFNPKYCLFDWGKNSQLYMSSNEGRDPAQYLSHLKQYILETEPKVEDMEKIMKFPRHLILLNPVRLAVEVARANQQQMQEILNLGIPIFDQNNLGNILMLGFLQKKNVFVTDPRGIHNYCSYKEGLKL